MTAKRDQVWDIRRRHRDPYATTGTADVGPLIESLDAMTERAETLDVNMRGMIERLASARADLTASRKRAETAERERDELRDGIQRFLRITGWNTAAESLPDTEALGRLGIACADYEECRRDRHKYATRPDWERVKAWWAKEDRAPASTAFTSGPEREIGYHLETLENELSTLHGAAQETQKFLRDAGHPHGHEALHAALGETRPADCPCVVCRDGTFIT